MKHKLLISTLFLLGAAIIGAVVYAAISVKNIKNPETIKVSAINKEAATTIEKKNVDIDTKEGNINPANYKNIKITDGVTTFSFDVPKTWLTETRHSGKEQPTIEVMRDFLATNFDGDIRAKEVCSEYEEEDAVSGTTKISTYCSTPTSDYADLAWEDIKNMSDQEVRDAFYAKNEETGEFIFPLATVTANDFIWYTDMAWYQIDFRIADESAEALVAKTKKETATYCAENENLVGCGDTASVWSQTYVDGQVAHFETYATDKDEKGKELISKGGTGGKRYYVTIPNSHKSLVIWKQAKGDEQFEKNFDHLIATFKFE